MTDALTGAPIEFVRVELTNADQSDHWAEYSDQVGEFYFGGLVDGDYYLLAAITFGDYLAEIYNDIPCDGYCDPLVGTPITIAGESDVEDIEMILDRAGKVFGRVTAAESGIGLSDVTVAVYLGCDGVSSARTDSTGRYEIVGLRSDSDYRVVASSFDHYLPQLYDGLALPSGCDLTAGTPVPVEVNAVTTDIDFSLDQGSIIEGTVTEASSGAPLEGVHIRVFGDDGVSTGWSVYTDALGRYSTIGGLEAGEYYLRASPSSFHIAELYDDVSCPGYCDPTSGTPVAVPEAATVSGIDFDLDVAARIEGSVVAADTGAPLVSVPVRLYNEAGGFVTTAYSSSGGFYGVGVESGSFFVAAGASSSYVAQLYQGLPCPSSSCAPSAGTPVAANLNSVTTGIDFALPRGGVISGVVTDVPSGAPITGILVHVYPTGSSFPISSNDTDSLGRFAARGLDTGQYFAEARRSPALHVHLPELYDEIPFPSYDGPEDGTPIDVVEGATTAGVDFTLDRGATVTGTVRAEGTGMPLSDVPVVLYDSNGYRLASDSSDGLGTYEIIGLSPGQVFLRTERSSPYFDEIYSEIACVEACDPTSGTPVPLAVNATTSGIDFSLMRGGLLLVRVRDAVSGQPLVNARVEVEGPAGFWESRSTNFDGHFLTQRLFGGDYRVRTTKSGYHGQRFGNLSCADSCDLPLATPIPINLGEDRAVDFELYPWGLDPDLRISHESVCLGDFTSCGTITLGPSLEICGESTFAARQTVSLLDGVSILAAVGISNDEPPACP